MRELKAWILVICLGTIVGCAIKYAMLPSKQEIESQRVYSKVFKECINSKEQKFAIGLVAGLNGQQVRNDVLSVVHDNICRDKAKKEAKI